MVLVRYGGTGFQHEAVVRHHVVGTRGAELVLTRVLEVAGNEPNDLAWCWLILGALVSETTPILSKSCLDNVAVLPQAGQLEEVSSVHGR